MLLITIALIVVIAYMATKLYRQDFVNEFEGFGTMLKDWVGCFSKAELGQEFKVCFYELTEAFKAFLLPIKTLGMISLIVLAPIVVLILNILTALVKVHKRN